MTLVRFDPFRELSTMQDRINRIFGDVYTRRADEDTLLRGDWMPPVDIFENEKKELVLKAELPDVKKEEVAVTVENNMLTFSGERKTDTEVRKEHYHRLERSFGRFSRSFSLPATVDTAKIGADFKNGVLTVRLPFREEAKPRSINIDVAS
jgi:HSP20 family protein